MFYRCIRPNEQKLPDDFEPDKVTIQLRYTGVLETTRIRREGYSHRIPFAEFLKRYVPQQLLYHIEVRTHGTEVYTLY